LSLGFGDQGWSNEQVISDHVLAPGKPLILLERLANLSGKCTKQAYIGREKTSVNIIRDNL
jgi:hypothetical protein